MSNYQTNNQGYNPNQTYNASSYSSNYPESMVFLCRGTCGTQKGCTCGRTERQ